MIKKLLTAVLCLSLVLASVSFSFASEESASDINATANFKCTELTEAQAIKRLSEIAGISLEDAATKIKTNKNSTMRLENSVRAVSYQEYSYTKSAGAGYKVEVGCLAIMGIGCGHSQFDGIVEDSVYSMATGSGPYTWNEGYSSANILNKGQLQLNARGTIEINYTTTVSATLKGKLIDAGFSTTNDHYFRKAVSINKTKTLSWWNN